MNNAQGQQLTMKSLAVANRALLALTEYGKGRVYVGKNDRVEDEIIALSLFIKNTVKSLSETEKAAREAAVLHQYTYVISANNCPVMISGTFMSQHAPGINPEMVAEDAADHASLSFEDLSFQEATVTISHDNVLMGGYTLYEQEKRQFMAVPHGDTTEEYAE